MELFGQLTRDLVRFKVVSIRGWFWPAAAAGDDAENSLSSPGGVPARGRSPLRRQRPGGDSTLIGFGAVGGVPSRQGVAPARERRRHRRRRLLAPRGVSGADLNIYSSSGLTPQSASRQIYGLSLLVPRGGAVVTQWKWETVELV